MSDTTAGLSRQTGLLVRPTIKSRENLKDQTHLRFRQARKKHLASLRQLERHEPVPRRSETGMLASKRHLGKFWSKNSSHLLSACFCTSLCVCVWCVVCVEEGKRGRNGPPARGRDRRKIQLWLCILRLDETS